MSSLGGTWSGEREAHAEHRGALVAEPRIRKNCVLIFQSALTENGSHALGVFKINGSFSPASSHLSETSVKDFPTATMRVSSSERAIQLFRGADRSTFNLMIASGDIRISIHLQDHCGFETQCAFPGMSVSGRSELIGVWWNQCPARKINGGPGTGVPAETCKTAYHA
jgi:hypothetical protein